MDETSMMWFRLRERRASLLNRWELQGNRPRQQTFAAAMTQFEEQMSAAKIVSPATRPLNLFYGLTQAGMAIVAAHAPGQWSFSRHGLKLLDTSRDLADIQVQPDGDGAFQRVAAAVGSTQIAEPRMHRKSLEFPTRSNRFYRALRYGKTRGLARNFGSPLPRFHLFG